MVQLTTLIFGTLALLGLATATPAPGPPGQHPVPINQRTAQEVISKLNLIPNIEKGYYIETFRDEALVPGTNRSYSTAIYYLLESKVGQSVWHRVDAVEVWHYYAGAPLTLSLSHDNGSPTRVITLGPDVFAGQQPQYAIDAWEWQSARSLGSWTLVGTTVAPGFVVEGSELAPPGWKPNGSRY
ncbi:DUF985 domain protein [Apodospora peruviana]|uniref:DUF985 domain protein n=1 Tax=Apodospora peruviana TaxID=516989 RepID=A0AAE0I648_9PEZI|nr:DUF985 domain protein [Apodospora peruviana]